MFKLLSDERFEEVSKEISESKEYMNVSDRSGELFQSIKDMLPPEGKKLLFELEECFSMKEAKTLCVCYEKGFRDALSVK